MTFEEILKYLFDENKLSYEFKNNKMLCNKNVIKN